MKKIFLIFTVLFTCALPVSGFGALDDFNAKFQEFQTRQQQQIQGFQARQQQQYNDFQSRNQQEITQFRKRSDDKIAELKERSAETFAKLEQSYNDFIKDTPFVNCVPGWSYLECKQVNNLQKSTWSCHLKPGITAQKMSSDVEAYCNQKSDAFEYDPLEDNDFEEPESEENNNGRIRMAAQTTELRPEEEVNAYAEYPADGNSDFMAAQQQDKRDWENPEYDTPEPADVATTPSVDKSASALLAQSAEQAKQSKKQKENTQKAKQGRQETNKKCTPEQLKQLNAKSGKLYYYAETPNTQYCGITTCNDNYVIDNSQQQEKCVCPKTDEFIETGGKCVRKTNLINIIGKVIDSDTKQPIKWVTVTYDEGKKDKEGKIKYGILKTGGNGMFNIDVIAGTTVKFEHNDYLVGEIQNAAPDTTAEVKLTPKSSEYLLFEGIVMDQETITPIPKAKIKYNKETITADENGKFDIRAPKDTVITFQAPGYNDREWKLEYETFEITEVPMTKTDKAAKNADLQKLCEKDGKGKWNKTLKSCNCNDKGAFFDETDGCTTATTEYNTSKEQLDTLYKQFKAQLASIKNATPQTADEK